MSTRNFKLVGAVEGECTGTITLNGTEIFNGTFVGNDWATGTSSNATPMCSGSMTFDDSSYVTFPVVVTVTAGSGQIQVGMFEWNWGFVVNPALTPEELSYIDVPWNEIPTDILNSVIAKGGFQIQEETDFDYGATTDQAFENRSNISLDGVSPPAGWDPNDGIAMAPGMTLSYDTNVFPGPQS